MQLSTFFPVLLLQVGASWAIGVCPPLGSVLPAPQQPSTNKVVQATASKIEALLLENVAALNDTALSVGIISAHEKTPILDFHHTPAIFNQSGTHNVTKDTIYIDASVSKAFTAFAILLLNDKVQLNDPVTKYVPELAQLSKEQSQVNAITAVDWSEVTIESLLSHLAGIGADLGSQDLANQPLDTVLAGFPPESTVPHSNCGDAPDQRTCTRQDFFAKFGMHDAVYQPFTTPVYSNIGYSILGFVIEAVSGESYADYMTNHVFKPLNLSHTSVGAPADTSLGFIPATANWWGSQPGFEASSGFIYSSPADLLTFGSAILTSTLLPSSTTSAWLKPKTFTSSRGIAVGAPWEIARGFNLTGDLRVIDFYSKAGNLDSYSALLVLIPDYDIVIVMNIAGGPASPTNPNGATLYGILSQIATAIVPAVDAAARQVAAEVYVGRYADPSTNSSLTLTTDAGPGLLVANWSVRGVDGRAAVAQYYGVPPAAVSARLYPTNLAAGNQTAWRAVYDTGSAAATAAQDAALFWADGTCQSWSLIDLLQYGLRALDEFVFETGEAGVVERVLARAWRVGMERSA